MSLPSLQQEALVWGVLQLRGAADSESAFSIDAVAGGSNFGNPQPVVEIVRSLLTDGVLAAVTGWDNRDIPIRLRISANDGEAMAEAEAALVQQCLLDQPPPLEWTSPVGNSATTIFDVVVARLEQDTGDDWDLDERWFGYRYYLLTLTCLPFARAVESTVIEALPVPVDPDVPTWTVVDAGSTLTPSGTYAGAWSRETNGTGPSGPTATTIGGETCISSSALITSGSQYLREVRTFTTPLTVTAGEYLAVDVQLDKADDFTSMWPGAWKIHDGTAYRDPVAAVAGGGEGGTTRLYFTIPGAVSTLKVLYDFDSSTGYENTFTLSVFSIAMTDTIVSSSETTNRQQSRLVSVLGSMPTNAVVRLFDATPDDLGSDILVYTTRTTAFLPNMRQWIDSSEGPTLDTDLVSGAKHALAPTDTVFLIPSSLLTLGTYALMARLNVAIAGTLSWSARMVTLAGVSTVGSGRVVSGEIEVDVTTDFEVIDLCALVLPVVEAEGTNHAVELTLSATTAMLLDEAWLFSLDDGALTWVKDTEGLDWIEVRSPELGASRPSVWGGRNVVGTNPTCIDWKCESFGAHRFEPGTMQIFTVTTTSLVSQCEIEFFPRYHSHVLGADTA